MKRRRLALVVLPVLAGASAVLWMRPPRDPVRRMALELPRAVDEKRIEAELSVLAARPHRAGTPANAAVADEVARKLREAGYEPTFEPHDVEVWEPVELKLSLAAKEPGRPTPAPSPAPPAALELDLHERAFPEDPQSAAAVEEVPFFAFSPDADVTAPVVYASFGGREDYELLRTRGVDPRGKLALVRAQGICRGRKDEIAAEFGVAGLLVYPELRDQGFKKEPYPKGPHLNLFTAQRGTLLLYHRQPGPPGPQGAPDPPVPALPLTPTAASEILTRIEGTPAPPDWTGWMSVPYRIGVGPEVRLVIRGRRERRQIRNVFARLEGESPDAAPIVVGSHLDAWVYGAVDPASGTQAVLEAARVLRRQRERWWKPARPLLFAFWDGEEYGMYGSTLWMSSRVASPFRSLAAYVNVDSAVRGNDFLGNVSAGLRSELRRTLDLVEEPGSGGRKLGELAGEAQLPGFSSDTAPFSGLAGVPVAEVGFGRWYPVYHSVYDSTRWLSRFGDPGAKRRAALVQVLGVYLAGLTQGTVLPWRLSEISSETARALDDLVRNAGPLAPGFSGPLAKVREAAAAQGRAAAELERHLDASRWRAREPGAIDAHLIAALTAFVSLPRPGFGKGDLLFGPSAESGCAGERLPSLGAAFSARDPAAFGVQAEKLVAAFEASRKELEAALPR